MYVIIEGADGVGKSSNAHRIAELLDMPYVHFGPPKEDARSEYLGFIEEHESAVLDRSWLGQWVYAPMWRDETPGYWSDIEAALRDHHRRVLYIILNSDRVFGDDNPTEIKKWHDPVTRQFLQVSKQITFGQKAIFNVQNFKNLDHELMTISRFAKQWRDMMWQVYPPFVDDYSMTLFNPGWRTIDGHLDVPHQCSCPYFSSHQQYDYYHDHGEVTWGAGSYKPRMVFVGEAPGWKGCGRLGIPFYNDKSGMLLRDAMFWSGLSEVDVYITNGLKCTPPANKLNAGFMGTDCTEHLDRELELIFKDVQPAESLAGPVVPWPKIFAVGRKPEQLLEYMGYPVTYLRHPAAALRSGQASQYHSEFFEAVRGYND